MKVLGISGTLVGSKTSHLVKNLIEMLNEQMTDVEVEFLDIKNYALDFCDGRPLEQYSVDTQEVIQKISEADAFIIGTTILHGSMPGVLKNLFELVPIPAFSNKCVLFAATGGNHLHYLAIENYVKPVANYLTMFALPQYIFVTSADFNDSNELVGEKLTETKHIVTAYASYVQKLANLKEEVK